MPYSKDTRTLQPGDIYVAIKGERFDGHAFVGDAIRKGASGVVVERPVGDVAGAASVMQVDSCERYLAELASRRIQAMRADIVAVTGSIGKTTTKNAIVTVLKRRYAVLSTPGNLNTPLGISLTVLNAHITDGTKLVLEMGATKSGDITELCSYFRPRVAVVTNVHGVHLSSFGTIEGVEEAKAEIICALHSSGTACLNYDAPRVRGMVRHHAGRIIYYGKDAACDVRPEQITSTLPLLGDHAIYVALAAFAAARAVGMDDVTVNEGLAELRAERGRLNMLPGRGQCTLIDDTYNASPASAAAALHILSAHPARRRIAFLGDMLELGSGSCEAHVRLLRLACLYADRVILVGPLMHDALASMSASSREGVRHFASSIEARGALEGGVGYQPKQGDVVLIKGSQGVRMEHITKALLRRDIVAEAVLVRQAQSWRYV